jgi:hypothetical protein
MPHERTFPVDFCRHVYYETLLLFPASLCSLLVKFIEMMEMAALMNRRLY